MNFSIPSACKGILPQENAAIAAKDPLVSWLNNKNHRNNKLPPLRSVSPSRALFRLINAKKVNNGKHERHYFLLLLSESLQWRIINVENVIIKVHTATKERCLITMAWNVTENPISKLQKAM